MSIKDWPGGVVSKNQVVPSGPYLDSTASGIWTMDQAASYTKQGIWPTAGNAEPDVASVFSTFLYTGTGAAQTITNGIDLTEGGLVWLKPRNAASDHALVDTERGGANSIASNTTAVQRTDGAYGLTFNSNGFDSTGGNLNVNGRKQVSWTWRKAPKFFTCLTYSGTGSVQNISHDLGSVPGMVVVKRTDATGAWRVYHRGANPTAPENYYLTLNATDQAGTGGGVIWNDTAPTDSVFTVGANNSVNASGGTYVAYLFGHETDASSMIQCGSYTGNGATNYTREITLGFEPQWVLIKRYDGASNWWVDDTMRGEKLLQPDDDQADITADFVQPTATGFKPGYPNQNGQSYIYMAIRNPMMIAPTVGTDVFMPLTYTATGSAGNKQTTGFPVDLTLIAARSGIDAWKHGVISRLTYGNAYLATNSTSAVASAGTTGLQLDDMTGYSFGGASFNNSSDMYNLSWKRAKSYLDVVRYSGTGVAGRTVSHNLGVAPEMMWIKRRDTTGSWMVYHKGLNGGTNPEQYVMYLNDTQAPDQTNGPWNYTAPASSVFTLGNNNGVNNSSGDYMAHLFASLDGISKVGSVSHSGTTNVDCGFSNGARFVMLKRYDAGSNWFVWDTARGISSGTDPYLRLNATGEEITNTDFVDPLSSGFTITSTFTAGDYIFYAIA